MQAKNVLKTIKTVLIWMVVVLAVFMMIFTVISVTTFNRNDRDLFGYKAYIVKTDSMSASGIQAGDLILSKEVDPNTLKPGDIITFLSQDTESFGEIVTHMIRAKTTDANGNAGFITYGTTTDVDDETVVTYLYILGKYEGHVPKLGTFFNFLKTPQGYIICIFIPFMLLIIHQGINSVKTFRRYKGEQMEQMKQEKEQLLEERAENARMMEELLALKAQLQKQAEEQTPTPNPEGDGADAEG
ncbi:MAG: signal peptidase I [Ruminococcaceae bacterium]|nr:signal peptidase I [Oscillospiraceae bacterium]